MNNMRRKEINAVITLLESIQEDVETFNNEEEEYYDNMPESIQCGECGEKASDAMDNLQSALDSLSEAIEYLEAAAE